MRDNINDNYALRILSDVTCCDGNSTDTKYLEMAKELVSRFTFVLDIACLGDGLDKLAEILGFPVSNSLKTPDKGHVHPPVDERFPFPRTYEYLKERLKLDIELYEWAKSIALVDCDVVQKEEEKAAAAAAGQNNNSS